MADESMVGQGATRLERRLATILCADVAGYSRMMGDNEERTVRVFRGHREVFDDLVSQHRGRIFNTAGDALLVEFASAVEAVRCATDVQAALRTRNEHLAPEERMLFRIGINLGDVIVQGGDLLGDGVNVASRIQAATPPGGICISGSVHDQIRNKLSLAFRPLGAQTFKNIAAPVRTYSIDDDGVAQPRGRRRSLAAPAAIAVAALLIAGGGLWGYRRWDAQRAELARTEARLAELAAQKRAAEQAESAALETRREALLQAQRQASEESVRRAQEERARVEEERKRLEAERRAADAARRLAATSPPVEAVTPAPSPGAPAASAPTVPPVPGTTPAAGRYDGTYNGSLCNHVKADAKPICWQVTLTVKDGAASGSWLSVTGNPSTAGGTIAANGVLEMKLTGWTRDGAPAEAALVGRVADDAMTASGKWRGGSAVSGEWKRQRLAGAGAPPASARYDGTYNGRLCNQPADRPQHCWPVALILKNGSAEATWRSRTNNESSATGSVESDGALSLKLAAWTRKGAPIEGMLSGRVVDDAIAASGHWRDGVTIIGDWKRALAEPGSTAARSNARPSESGR